MQGCQIAARTYRGRARANRPVAARTISDATVTDRVRDLAWKVDHEAVRSDAADAIIDWLIATDENTYEFLGTLVDRLRDVLSRPADWLLHPGCS